MRDQVRGLSGELGELDTTRFVSHFDQLEATALLLVQEFESRRTVVTH
jgi:hypothetical protein